MKKMISLIYQKCDGMIDICHTQDIYKKRSDTYKIFGGIKSMADKKTSDAQLRAQKKYDQDSINFAISYKRLERDEGLRLKEFLSQNSLKANAYIKSLIKADLDAKGFSVNSAATMDIDSVDTL